MAALTVQKADNARNVARQRVLLGGRIVFGQDFTCECTIRDLSETGARVRVPPGASLPNEFVLVDLPHGRAFEATVAWRRDEHLGVAFRAAHDLTGTVPPEFQRIRAIWIAARFH